MAISLQADPTLALGYLKINGTTSATVSPSGVQPSWLVKSAAYTASNGDMILADTSGGAFTITLPLFPVTGSQIVVADGGGKWATNPLTVARNSSTIEGLLNEDLNCNVNNKRISLYFNGTTWRIVA